MEGHGGAKIVITFGNRLGLIYVDFDTLERIPKLSAEWFRAAARQNAGRLSTTRLF